MNHQQYADYRPVFILCPGRSFSSVVCGMLGQHPELYGLPETNFFVADTVRGIFQHFAGPKDRHRIDSLVRALAQLHEGDQTEATAEQAWQWLRDRPDMPTRDLAWHVAMHGGHRQIVEKSPSNCAEPAHLARLYRTFPSARFLHLLRHPYSSGKSLYEFYYQDFRFSSFPRMRESSHSLKRMDTRLRGYDEFTGLAKVLTMRKISKDF